MDASNLGWRLAAGALLALFLGAAVRFISSHFVFHGFRLKIRPATLSQNSTLQNRTSGAPGGERPPRTPESNAARYPVILRSLIVAMLLAGVYYLQWRWFRSVQWANWPVAVPLLLAETFAFAEMWFLALTLWRLRPQREPPPAPVGATVDVFVTCYNESVELVRTTVKAARSIRYPHETYVLDDGSNPAMRAMALEEGVGYIVRSVEWRGKNRHAKAGNIGGAMMETGGEFILLQDADQIPYPNILDRILGYFNDPKVAFVQTPHWFYNAPHSDPFGAQSFVFYGPIQQGRDGFNAAFFCGSNGVIRREALMQAAVKDYADDRTERLRRALREAENILQAAERQLPEDQAEHVGPAIREIRLAAREARAAAAARTPVQELTAAFQRRVRAVSQRLVLDQMERIHADLAEAEGPAPRVASQDGMSPERVQLLLDREYSPLAALERVQELIHSLDLDRAHEAQPLLPFATISVTEDMATSMHIHALGWRSVYHHEILARGLAPEDLRSALSQRLRWAQGAVQVFLRRNPLTMRGLSVAQRILYLHTALAYGSGFTAIAFMAAPLVFLLFGWASLRTYGPDLWLHLLPYLVLSQLLYRFWTSGLPVWRLEQYSLAYFPVWIRATWTAFANVYLGRKLGFIVTPKTRQGGIYWGPVFWQLLFIGLLCAGLFWALGRVVLGVERDGLSAVVNSIWVCLDILLLSVVIDAVLYQPKETAEPQPETV